MENIQWMSDSHLMILTGVKIKKWRLEQDISQKLLADRAALSIATIVKAEKGENISWSNFLKILRVLNKLQYYEPFITEEQLSPIEYDKMLSGIKPKKRASKNIQNNDTNHQGEPFW